MFKDIYQKIEKEATAFFKKISPEAEVHIERQDENIISVMVKTNQPQILIGQNGRTLVLCQNLLTKILRKKTDQEFYLDLDINNYKKKKIDYLKEMARMVADEVALSKKARELEPMSAYERRIIHLELRNRKDVNTESIGQEPERRVVVKPIETS